jgi:hypothetical protein
VEAIAPASIQDMNLGGSSTFADREIVQLELVAGDFRQAWNFDFDGAQGLETFPRFGAIKHREQWRFAVIPHDQPLHPLLVFIKEVRYLGDGILIFEDDNDEQ